MARGVVAAQERIERISRQVAVCSGEGTAGAWGTYHPALPTTMQPARAAAWQAAARSTSVHVCPTLPPHCAGLHSPHLQRPTHLREHL